LGGSGDPYLDGHPVPKKLRPEETDTGFIAGVPVAGDIIAGNVAADGVFGGILSSTETVGECLNEAGPSHSRRPDNGISGGVGVASRIVPLDLDATYSSIAGAADMANPASADHCGSYSSRLRIPEAPYFEAQETLRQSKSVSVVASSGVCRSHPSHLRVTNLGIVSTCELPSSGGPEVATRIGPSLAVPSRSGKRRRLGVKTAPLPP
jgi:hypothetical protein